MLRRKLTPKEIAYYKDVGKFEISEWLDEDIINKIRNMATIDIAKGNKKRTPKDFKSKLEYDYYIADLYDIADREEKGIPWN